MDKTDESKKTEPKEKERKQVMCPICYGTGYTTSFVWVVMTRTMCWRCAGKRQVDQ